MAEPPAVETTGLMKVRGCCVFTWRRDTETRVRYADVRAYHCVECISALKAMRPPFVLVQNAVTTEALAARLGVGPVLVVDDDPAICEAICDVLADVGCVALKTQSAAAALAYLRSGFPLPKVLFLDLMMPEMDGYQLHSELRADPRLAKIPVVVVTAVRPDAERLRGTPILRKPVQLDAVLAALELSGSRRTPGPIPSA